ISELELRKRISQARVSEANSPFSKPFSTLFLQREVRYVPDIVKKPNTAANHTSQQIPVKVCVFGEGISHHASKVDMTEITSIMGWKGLLAARIGTPDIFAIPEVIKLVDAIDVYNTRFRVLIGVPRN